MARPFDNFMSPAEFFTASCSFPREDTLVSVSLLSLSLMCCFIVFSRFLIIVEVFPSVLLSTIGKKSNFAVGFLFKPRALPAWEAAETVSPPALSFSGLVDYLDWDLSVEPFLAMPLNMPNIFLVWRVSPPAISFSCFPLSAFSYWWVALAASWIYPIDYRILIDLRFIGSKLFSCDSDLGVDILGDGSAAPFLCRGINSESGLWSRCLIPRLSILQALKTRRSLWS